MSPDVGRIDEQAFDATLSADPDAAVGMLADMAVATDPQLRAQARTLARRLLPPLGRVGAPRRRGTRRMTSRAGMIEGDLDLERTLERSGGARPRGPGISSSDSSRPPRARCACSWTAAAR